MNAKGMVLWGLNNHLLTGDEEDIIGYLSPGFLSVDTEGFSSDFPALANVQEDDNPVIFHFKFKGHGMEN